MLDWINHKLESRLPREILTTSDKQMITTLMAEGEEELAIYFEVPRVKKVRTVS